MHETDIRVCTECLKAVYRCDSEAEARLREAAGRLAAIRELVLGVGPLLNHDEPRRTWLQLALLCDVCDTVAAAAGARGDGFSRSVTARTAAVTITSGLLTLGALRQES